MALLYLAYAAVCGLAVIVFVRSVPIFLDPGSAITVDPQSATGVLLGPLLVLTGAIALATSVMFVGMGLFVLRARPKDRFALLVSLVAIVEGLEVVSGVQLPWVDPAWSLPVFALSALGSVITLGAMLTLPDGRFVPRWSLAILGMYAVWNVVAVVAVSLGPCLCGAGSTILSIAFLAVASGTQVYRYRVVTTQRQRDQMKWITVALIVYVLALALARASGFVWPSEYQTINRWVANPVTLAPDALGLLVVTAARILLRFAQVGVALAFAIAILRARLLDIDLVINRALLYASVTALLVAVFAVVSTLTQFALKAFGFEGPGILTALIAVATSATFGSLRSRLAPFVDRLLPARALLTLMFVDLVRSTERAAALGDERWHDLLDAYRAAVRRETARSGGREIDNAGDGFFLIFRDTSRAMRAAARARTAVRDLGLEVRIGLHVGECQMRGEKPTGIAVHAAARVMAQARPGEIYVSAEAREALTGTGVLLVDRGLCPLKGVPGQWHLYLADPAPAT